MADTETQSPFDASFDAMTAPFTAMAQGLNGSMGRMMQANAEAGRDAMTGVGRMAQELMDFAGRRMQEDLRTAQRLSACQDPSEAMRIQSECVSAMVQAYMDEMQRIADMAGATGEAWMNRMDEGFREDAPEAEAAAEKPAGTTKSGTRKQSA
jgi:hypothetical protein